MLRLGRHEKAISGAEDRTTPQRMELTALLGALRILVEPCAIAVFAPSPFLRDGLQRWTGEWTEKGWRNRAARPVHNAELWHQVIRLAAAHALEWSSAPHPEAARVAEMAALAGRRE